MTTKFGPEVQNTFVKIFIVLGAIDHDLLDEISGFTTTGNT